MWNHYTGYNSTITGKTIGGKDISIAAAGYEEEDDILNVMVLSNDAVPSGLFHSMTIWIASMEDPANMASITLRDPIDPPDIPHYEACYFQMRSWVLKMGDEVMTKYTDGKIIYDIREKIDGL